MKLQKITRGMSPLRATGRFFRPHPWALCLLLFLLMLYKYYFSWFTVLVTTSPIFLIAGIFLGIIVAYGEPNNTEKDHFYKKIEKSHVQNVNNGGKSVGGASLPGIPSREERMAQHKNTEKKIRKTNHVVGSTSEPVSSESEGGSDTDTTPMLHTFHHLRSASDSSHSSQDGDSSDSSVEGGTANQEGNNGNVRERKQDGKAVAWTADDQKNILKIGSLEIERNQRLESLVARRRARNYADRMLGFGSNDSLPNIEELSKFNVQIPAVFAPRKNPFDLPYNEDNFPDSAPSAPLPTANPFDLPREQEHVSSSAEGANSSHEEPITAASLLQSSALFRRHESFTKGAPFLNDFLQDTRPSRLRPYFVTEKMANEEVASSSLVGETNEKGSSKATSAQDSDSTSSVTDQESQKDVLKDCSNNQEQLPLLNPVEEQVHATQHVREVSLVFDMEPPVLISDSSDDDISLSGEYINDWVEAQNSENLNLPRDTLLEEHNIMQQHQEIEITRNSLHQLSPHSNDLELTSSSTESTDDPFEVDGIEEPAKDVVVTDDDHIPDPVYDSSPSGSEKPASIGLVIDEAGLQCDGCAGHAHTSNAEAGIGEGVSSSTTETSSSELAQPSLHSVEQSELGEKETSMSRDKERATVDNDEATAEGSVSHVDKEHATVDNDEATAEGSVSHVDRSVSDISSQTTTESPTNGKSGSSIIESSKNALFGFF